MNEASIDVRLDCLNGQGWDPDNAVMIMFRVYRVPGWADRIILPRRFGWGGPPAHWGTVSHDQALTGLGREYSVRNTPDELNPLGQEPDLNFQTRP